MSCIQRRPDCGDRESATKLPEPFGDIFTVLGGVAIVFGMVSALLTTAGAVTVSEGAVSVAIAGKALFSVGTAGVGALGAAAGAIATIIVVTTYAIDRCTQGKGEPECIAGVIHDIVSSFSNASEELFPFTAVHDRVDVVVKSRFWDVVESHNAFVQCTEEASPRRSELLRCYFYDPRVCQAAKGALVGAAVGGVAGVLIAAGVIAAIGCTTGPLCLLALLLAAVIAVITTLLGALIGGQIGKAVAEDKTPGADRDGPALSIGDFVTIKGNLKRRDNDQGANTFWWSTGASLHGRASDGAPRPFSYCELDEAFPVDGCLVVQDPPK